MDWVFDNFQLVVFLFVAAVWVLRSLFGAKKPEAEESTQAPAPGEDPGEADRTRQIQEEIRRRILARQRGETVPPPVPSTPPPVIVYQESARDEREVIEEEYLEEGPRVPMPTAAAHRQADVAQAAILEQQRQLAEQLHALRAARAAGASLAPLAPVRLPHDASAAIAAHQRSCVREVRRDLRHPSSVRRAVLLKEILGEPIALRRGWQLPRR